MKSSWLFVMCVLTGISVAQTNWSDTVVQLNSVSVVVTKQHFLKSGVDGITDAPFDTAFSFSLSDLLQQNTRFFVKRYGVSSLASINYKGTSAAQNNILWNGFKLNTPANGQSDLNILLSAAADNAYVLQSGNNGTIGSNILLESDLDNLTKVSNQFALEAGSFQTVRLHNTLKYRYRFFSGKTALTFQQAKNNFSYTNRFLSNEKTTVSHAAMQTYGWMQEMKFKINTHHSIMAAYWMNQAMREIPPVMTQAESKQWQEDEAHRAIVVYDFTKKSVAMNLKSAIMLENMRYADPSLSIFSVMKNLSSQSQLNAVATLKSKWTIQGQGFYTYEQAVSPSFTAKASRNLYGLKAQLKYKIVADHELSLLLKQEMINTQNAPFSFHFYYAGKSSLSKTSLNWNISLARAYRIPSLNDLYWSVGGNSQLKPEKSYNSEVNLTVNNRRAGNFSINPFVIYAIDWIQWSPVVGAYWSAANYKKVLSRGFSFSTKNLLSVIANHCQPLHPKLAIGYGLQLSHTKITALATNDKEPNAIGKQLIYQPKWQCDAALSLHTFGFSAAYRVDYTDKRFISSDNSTFLPAYLLHSLSFSKSFVINAVDYACTFSVDNIADKTYEVIALRPMPGRAFNFKFLVVI